MLQFNFHLRPQLHQATPYREEGKKICNGYLISRREIKEMDVCKKSKKLRI